MYMNEWDLKTAKWLTALFPSAHIDNRSIADVSGSDLAAFSRCHFFAGIGGWEYALQLAGIPSDFASIWTGSCPCQPFSVAGRGKGTADERHLWPEFCRLIDQCRPSIVFGEQVASKAGREWLSGVRSDLEALGYAVGAADLCAACVGAPHIRQRLYWGAIRLGNTQHPRFQGFRESLREQPQYSSGGGKTAPAGDAYSGRMANNASNGRDEGHPDRRELLPDGNGQTEWNGLADHSHFGTWSQYDIIPFQGGKERRIEPGTFPLAHGVPNRVVKLRGYGNAIVPQVAAAFVSSFLESLIDSSPYSDI